jgi:hypothetical protein
MDSNFRFRASGDTPVREVIKAAKDHGCSMRIGVNAGSLERDLLERYGEPCPEAMVESALNHAKILEDNDFFEFKISCKASAVFLAVAAYQQLAEACDYPLHLGITEAGALRCGTVKSSIGLGMLLWSGIGDTIRVSLSADPVEEVKVGFEMLKSLGLRRRGVTVISCPSCAPAIRGHQDRRTPRGTARAVSTGLPAGGNRIRTFGPPWTPRSPFSAWIAFERRLGLRIELAPLDRRVGRLRRENLVEVLHEADCVLDCHQGALIHFRS